MTPSEIKQAIETIRTLVEYLEEAHQDEIDKKHYGDKEPCSYCRAIREGTRLADKIEEELYA